MTDQTVRIGIVGAGRNTTSRHIPGLQAVPGVEILSVCNRSLESSRRVADQFKIPRVQASWTELVADPDIDAVLIGTWPYLHHPVTLAALAQNRHVLCEARMAMDASQAREMLAASRAKPGLVTQIVPSPYSLKFDRTIQRLIREGYLGEILALEVFDQGSFLDVDSPIQWRQDITLSGCNTMSLGIWYEAVLRWVGAAQVVSAMGKTFIKRRPDSQTGVLKAVQIPEHIDVTADMVCGAQAHFAISQAAGFGRASEASIYGSLGTLKLVGGKLYGAQKGDPGLQEILISPQEAGHWRVEEEFIHAIRGLEPIRLTTFEDGVRYMEFTEAVIRSISERRAVPLA